MICLYSTVYYIMPTCSVQSYWETEAEGLEDDHGCTEVCVDSVNDDFVQEQPKPVVLCKDDSVWVCGACVCVCLRVCLCECECVSRESVKPHPPGGVGLLMGLRREILRTRSVHLFCATESRAVLPGLLALKLFTTIPTNSWRPMLTPKNKKMCR